ncbi:MAG: MotA/TolQ/ExbB proton channel family protein, partial [Pseudomonadota bacterium]
GLGFSPYRLMFHEGYNELSKIRGSADSVSKDILLNHFQHFGMGAIERALKKGANESQKQLEQYLSMLASIGSISPFIGLFGTVWGIINAFRGLAGGGSTLDAVAPGIAEALVTTAIGIFAAIPAVWFYNYFVSINSRMNSDMDNFAQDFTNLVERSLLQK